MKKKVTNRKKKEKNLKKYILFLKNLVRGAWNAKNAVILILCQEQYVIDVNLQSNQNFWNK